MTSRRKRMTWTTLVLVVFVAVHNNHSCQAFVEQQHASSIHVRCHHGRLLPIRVPKPNNAVLTMPAPMNHASFVINSQRVFCFYDSTKRSLLIRSNSNQNNADDDLSSRKSSSTSDQPQRKKEDDEYFQSRNIISVIAGQSLLVVAAVTIATFVFQIPNYGLGTSFHLGWQHVQSGAVATLPLVFIAYVLDQAEPHVPWLQDVTLATQRTILALLGGTWKPLVAILVSLLLSLAAGVGEEILFRGVLQYELVQRWNFTWGLVLSSIVFGALHAATPLYAALATLASCYFGWLYWTFDNNLAIPMVTHSIYDFGAILYAHYTVSRLTEAEREAVYNWEGPGTTDDNSKLMNSKIWNNCNSS